MLLTYFYCNAFEKQEFHRDICVQFSVRLCYAVFRAVISRMNYAERKLRVRQWRKGKMRTCRHSCWPSWPFAERPRFIEGRDLGSRPLVPKVGLVGFLLSALRGLKGRRVEKGARDLQMSALAILLPKQNGLFITGCQHGHAATAHCSKIQNKVHFREIT